MSFTYCLNTATIMPQPLLRKIELTAQAGYAGVELWVNDIYQFIGRGGEVSDIEKAIADNGLIVPCMIACRQWAEMVGREYELALDEARRRMELATRLGSPYFVATPPREPCDPAQITAHYKDLLDIGREIGIKPTFEYIGFFKSVPDLALAHKIAADTGDPDATVILDSFHTWNSGGTLDDLRAIPVEMISHYHIDDAAPDKPKGSQTDPDRVMIGEGPIDLKAEMDVLKEKGYAGTISLELFNKSYWQQDPLELITRGLEKMREVCE